MSQSSVLKPGRPAAAQEAAAATAVALELENPRVSEPEHTASDRPDFHEIARLAHRLWTERGCPEGSPEVDWLRAEQELGGQRR